MSDPLIGPGLEAKVREVCKIPEGWQAFKEMIRDYELDEKGVQAFLKQVRKENPTKIKDCWDHPNLWVKYVDPQDGARKRFMHPDLIQWIEEELSSYE